ncbi:MAG: hypothetical protein Q8838_02790, partial [Candidatus Phytoplasma australasiaticum]|nr:hypothetical protein [Candidatus Phytoplasma australasiaticum]
MLQRRFWGWKSIGTEIRRNFVSLKGYTQKILSRFGMSNAKPLNTPCASNIHLSVAFAPKSAEEKEYMSQ